jgi:hypothetical protein
VKPIVDDVIALLEGRDKDVKNSFVLKARDAMVAFGVAAKKAVTEIILPALAALLKVLGGVATAINAVFGTDISGSQIAIALVITKMIGLFSLFTGAIRLVISAIGLLVAAFGAVPIAIAAVGFAIGFVIVRALQAVDWAGFLKAATNVFNAIVRGVGGVATSIVTGFNTAVQFVVGAWNGVVSFFSGLVATIGGFFNDAAILISNAFFTSVQFVTDIWNGLLAFFAALPGTVGGFFVSVGEAIKAAFSDAVNAVKGFIDDLWNKITSVFTNIIAAAQRVTSAVKAALGGGGGGDVQGPGFARGGPVRGPGTDERLHSRVALKR